MPTTYSALINICREYVFVSCNVEELVENLFHEIIVESFVARYLSKLECQAHDNLTQINYC